MFGLGIEYLTGRAVAADPGDRNAPEWPPHPARVFMAMLAAHHEGDGTESERRALTWLESLPPPAISASPAYVRRGWDRRGRFQPTAISSTEDDLGPVAATVFVPANDRLHEKDRGQLQSTPGLARNKGARTFPGVRPLDDLVFLIWKEAVPEKIRPALETLCAKVTRIGHSSSLVRMWVEDDPASSTWRPTEDEAVTQLRVATRGYLDLLEASYRRDPTRRPTGAAWQGYARVTDRVPPVPGTIWKPTLISLRMEPLETPFRHLDLVSTLGLTAGLHRAVVSLVPDPVPEFVSGHDLQGNPSDSPHLAYLPLGWVGSRYADGLIRGFGITLPRGLGRAERRTVYGALGRLRELKLGRLGRWEVESGHPDAMPATLQSWTWTGGRSGARRWSSVTPVAFDRHPKGKGEAYQAEVVTMIRKACLNIGLPEPTDVWLGPVSAHAGVPAAREFPRLRRKDGSERRHTHTQIQFAKKVHGPISIGAGRYRGYGLLRPLREQGPSPGGNR